MLGVQLSVLGEALCPDIQRTERNLFVELWVVVLDDIRLNESLSNSNFKNDTDHTQTSFIIMINKGELPASELEYRSTHYQRHKRIRQHRVGTSEMIEQDFRAG